MKKLLGLLCALVLLCGCGAERRQVLKEPVRAVWYAFPIMRKQAGWTGKRMKRRSARSLMIF
ncbi:MAG: hypothetical protein IKF51_07145 [Solobacterium sp.]|nr:hypothetical protein [Solobacterium sp.]